MSGSLLVAGIVCMVAAVVGGGIKLLGAEVPALNSFPRQALLFALGLVFLVISFQVGDQKPASPSASNQTASGASVASTAPVQHLPSSGATTGCSPDAALSCLPRSSAPVTFANPDAANQAAQKNLADGLSTSAAQAQAQTQGASGKAARLCGILASNDSSPLGKHLAALRLNNPVATDGQASGPCLTLAQNFL